MNTTEVIKLLAKRLDIPQREARVLLYAQFDAITRHLLEDHTVIQRGFGSFGVKETAPRRAYVPAKKAVCDIPAKRKVFFRIGKQLKEALAAWRPR